MIVSFPARYPRSVIAQENVRASGSPKGSSPCGAAMRPGPGRDGRPHSPGHHQRVSHPHGECRTARDHSRARRQPRGQPGLWPANFAAPQPAHSVHRDLTGQPAPLESKPNGQ
jgi:hypothetical protein